MHRLTVYGYIYSLQLKLIDLQNHFVLKDRFSAILSVGYPERDIRIGNQFLITRALHFAQPRQPYYQASVTITLGRRV